MEVPAEFLLQQQAWLLTDNLQYSNIIIGDYILKMPTFSGLCFDKVHEWLATF